KLLTREEIMSEYANRYRDLYRDGADADLTEVDRLEHETFELQEFFEGLSNDFSTLNSDIVEQREELDNELYEDEEEDEGWEEDDEYEEEWEDDDEEWEDENGW